MQGGLCCSGTAADPPDPAFAETPAPTAMKDGRPSKEIVPRFGRSSMLCPVRYLTVQGRSFFCSKGGGWRRKTKKHPRPCGSAPVRASPPAVQLSPSISLAAAAGLAAPASARRPLRCGIVEPLHFAPPHPQPVHHLQPGGLVVVGRIPARGRGRAVGAAGSVSCVTKVTKDWRRARGEAGSQHHVSNRLRMSPTDSASCGYDARRAPADRRV